MTSQVYMKPTAEDQHGLQRLLTNIGTDGDYSLSWQVVSLTEHLKGLPFLFCLKEGILEARG